MLVHQSDTAMPPKRIDKALREFQGNRLRERREKLLLTQAELALKVGLQKQAILKYESGDSSPTLDIAKRIAKALNTNISYLSGEVNYEGELTERQEVALLELDKRRGTLGRPLTDGELAEFYDSDEFGNNENSSISG